MPNVQLETENLDFDPSAFFGNSTGGMFTASAETVVAENEKPKKSQFAAAGFGGGGSSGFGSSWKKKKDTKISMSISLSSQTSNKIEVRRVCLFLTLVSRVTGRN